MLLAVDPLAGPGVVRTLPIAPVATASWSTRVVDRRNRGGPIPRFISSMR